MLLKRNWIHFSFFSFSDRANRRNYFLLQRNCYSRTNKLNRFDLFLTRSDLNNQIFVELQSPWQIHVDNSIRKQLERELCVLNNFSICRNYYCILSINELSIQTWSSVPGVYYVRIYCRECRDMATIPQHCFPMSIKSSSIDRIGVSPIFFIVFNFEFIVPIIIYENNKNE